MIQDLLTMAQKFFIPSTNPKKNQNLRFYTIADNFQILLWTIYWVTTKQEKNVDKKVLSLVQNCIFQLQPTQFSLGARPGSNRQPPETF